MTIKKPCILGGVGFDRILPGIFILLAWAKGVFAIDTSIVWREDFSLVPIGTRPADWTITAKPKEACMVVGMAGSIEKVLKFNSLDCNETLSAEKRFTPSHGLVIMEWRFFESESGRGQTFIVENPKGEAVLQLFVDPSGNLRHERDLVVLA